MGDGKRKDFNMGERFERGNLGVGRLFGILRFYRRNHRRTIIELSLTKKRTTSIDLFCHPSRLILSFSVIGLGTPL